MSRIIKVTSENLNDAIRTAVDVLKSGGIVVYPTETVYGIGVDATNQLAVNKLLEYKTRREGKPLSVAVSGEEMAAMYVEVNDTARNLYRNFLPGPITVVSKGKGRLAKGVESEIGTLGIRIPDYPMILEIVKMFDRPVTASSANASNQKRPYSISDIFDGISDKQKGLLDLILDVGTLPKREPSTVVDTTLNQEVVLRQGDIKLNTLFKKKTQSADETQQLGYDLMKKYLHHLGYKSVIFALQGELGAGKTQLSKGIGRCLGVSDEIQSPTFIIEKEYSVEDKHMYHIDTWRLFDEQELLELQFMRKVDEGNVFVVEWANKVKGLIDQISDNSVVVWVSLEYGNSENERLIIVSDYSEKA